MSIEKRKNLRKTIDSTGNRFDLHSYPLTRHGAYIRKNGSLYVLNAHAQAGQCFTKKENTLGPYRYLTHVLGSAPNLDESNPDWAEQPLPENAPEYCNTNHRKK